MAGALLLIVSTLGPFSFVEAAEVLIAIGVIVLLGARADGRGFQLPIRDGTVVMAAGAWAALLIVVRLLDRPLGQNLLALGCAAILVVAGISLRTKEPAPDRRRAREPEQDEDPTDWLGGSDATPRTRRPPAAERTTRLPADTEPLPPPEFPTTQVRRAPEEPEEPDEDTTKRLPAPDDPLPPPEFDPAPSADRSGAPPGRDPHEEETDTGGDELEGGRDEDRLR